MWCWLLPWPVLPSPTVCYELSVCSVWYQLINMGMTTVVVTSLQTSDVFLFIREALSHISSRHWLSCRFAEASCTRHISACGDAGVRKADYDYSYYYNFSIIIIPCEHITVHIRFVCLRALFTISYRSQTDQTLAITVVVVTDFVVVVVVVTLVVCLFAVHQSVGVQVPFCI